MNKRVVTRALVVAAGAVLAVAPMASAHVTVNPGEAAQGGFAALSFRVPNEQQDADTTSVEVNIPTDHPIASVSVKPLAGWTYKVETAKLDTPIKTDDGDEVSEAVSKITWTGGTIKPGEFQEFEISAGPLPETDQVSFPTIQTYSKGEPVRWIDKTVEGQPEPEHPAPTLKLVKGTGDHDAEPATSGGGDENASGVSVTNAASQSDVDTANTLGIVGIVVGVLGLGVALFALLRKRGGGTAAG
ncbi:MAG TPA: YcnI family protein [Acidimicrobiales bacterium]|nr:YcnI family protein [Acidimicrobiales bacterium]